MYTGYEIDPDSRSKLASLYPPKNPRFMGHHITEAFGVKDGSVPEQPKSITIVGHINNEENGVEGFIVEIDGTTARPDGGTYHLTWSLDPEKGAKPVHTNNHVDEAVRVRPIEIDAHARFFTGGGQSYSKGEFKTT